MADAHIRQMTLTPCNWTLLALCYTRLQTRLGSRPGWRRSGNCPAPGLRLKAVYFGPSSEAGVTAAHDPSKVEPDFRGMSQTFILNLARPPTNAHFHWLSRDKVPKRCTTDGSFRTMTRRGHRATAAPQTAGSPIKACVAQAGWFGSVSRRRLAGS
jgi:hypothetical protein